MICQKRLKQYQQKDEQKIDKFSILNGVKYFSLRIFQIFLVFIPNKKYIKYFSSTTCVEVFA